MSDDNKLGSSLGSSLNPDDPQYLIAAEAQLSIPPSQPFSINKQYDQSNKSDDSGTKRSQDADKKEDVKKQQAHQAALLAASRQAQATYKKPSPLDSSFQTNLKDNKPVTLSKKESVATPVKEKSSLFSLSNKSEKPPSKEGFPLKDLLKSSQSTPSVKNLNTPTKMEPQAPPAPLKTPLKSTDLADFVKAGSLTQRSSAESTPLEKQNSQTTTPLSQHVTDVHTITSDKDIDWKDKQTITSDKDIDWKDKKKIVRKDDIEDTHLNRKFTGEKIEAQTQSKIETSNEITPSSGSTGTDIAQRVAQAIASQTDFVNLVASIATNQKTTQVQLKDGTLINLDRSDRGLKIHVTTSDTRVQRLLIDNRNSITQALNEKNIPVADLQVSMEYGGSDKPIEGIGKE